MSFTRFEVDRFAAWTNVMEPQHARQPIWPNYLCMIHLEPPIWEITPYDVAHVPFPEPWFELPINLRHRPIPSARLPAKERSRKLSIDSFFVVPELAGLS